MKRTIILHIGHHKTGTSSLQLALKLNSKILAEKGYYFFSLAPDGSCIADGNSSWWIDCSGEISQAGGTIKSPSLLSEMLSKSGHNVIMSAESFSWIFNPEELLALKSGLHKYFDEVVIYASFRRQDQLLFSMAKQAVFNPNGPINRFISRDELTPLFTLYYYNYMNFHEKMTMWKDVFVNASFVFSIYDGSTDSATDFFSRFGFKIPNTVYKENESISSEKYLMAKFMNDLKVERNFKYHVLQGDEGCTRYIPSRVVAKKLYEYFSESNTCFCHEFSRELQGQVFNLDFDMYADCDVRDLEPMNEACKIALDKSHKLFYQQMELNYALLKQIKSLGGSVAEYAQNFKSLYPLNFK